MSSEPFVPLTIAPASSGAGQDFRVLVAENPERAQAFRPRAAAGSGAASESTTANPVCDPQVSLQREGDRVTAIHIQCSCGEVIDLACVY